MKADDFEGKLRELYGNMKSEDAKNASSFDNVISRPHRKATLHFSMLRLSAAAAVALSVASGAIIMQMRTNSPVESLQNEKWADASGWEAATDNLLTISYVNTEASLSTDTDMLFDYSGRN